MFKDKGIVLKITGVFALVTVLLQSAYYESSSDFIQNINREDVPTLSTYIESKCPKTVLQSFTMDEYAEGRLPDDLTKLLVLDNSVLGATEREIDPVVFPDSIESNAYLLYNLGLDVENTDIYSQVMALDVITLENDLMLSEIDEARLIYKDSSIEGNNLDYIADKLDKSSSLVYTISEDVKNGKHVDKGTVDALMSYEVYKSLVYKGGRIQPLDKSTDKASRVKESADTSITQDYDLTTDWLDISDEKRDRMNSLCTGVPMYSTSELVNTMVASIINTYCTDDMTPADKAYTCYKYIMANTKYAKYTYSKALYENIGIGGDGEWVDANGKVQWTKRLSESYAVARIYSMLSDKIKKGACDNYAAATTACFRALGFDARVVAKNGIHFWCEVVDPVTGDSYVFDNELQGKGQNIEHTNEDAKYNEFFCSTKDEAETYWKVYTQGSTSQGMSYAKSSDYNSIFNIDSPIYEGTYAYNVAVMS